MTRTGRYLALLSLCAAVSGCGVTASSRNPGFADIDVPSGAGLARDTSISIGPALLRLAARHADEGPQTTAMLQALDGVRIRVYRVGPATVLPDLYRSLDHSARRLGEADWQPVMRVVEENSVVHMLVREEDGQLLGLALISADEEELVVVNLMGRLDPATLDGLAGSLGEEALALRSNAR